MEKIFNLLNKYAKLIPVIWVAKQQYGTKALNDNNYDKSRYNSLVLRN